MSSDASVAELVKYKAFYDGFTVMWRRKCQDLKKYVANLSAYTAKIHATMIADVKSLEAILLPRAAVAAEQVVCERLQGVHSMEGLLKAVDALKDDYHAMLSESQRHRLGVKASSTHPTIAFEMTDLGSVGGESLAKLVSARVETIRALQTQLLQPMTTLKAALEKQKRWKEPPRSREPPTVADVLRHSIDALVHSAQQAQADVEMFRQAPSMAVASLPQLKRTPSPSLEWVAAHVGGGGAAKNSPRRRAAAQIRSERAVSLPQMELVVHRGGTEVVATDELRGHDRERDAHHRAVHDRLEKGLDDVAVDPFKGLRLEHARIARQRAKLGTESIAAFLTVVNKEVAMLGSAGDKKRKEDALIMQYKMQSLRPTVQNSSATLNSSAPEHRLKDDGGNMEEPAVGKILKRKLRQSRKMAKE